MPAVLECEAEPRPEILPWIAPPDASDHSRSATRTKEGSKGEAPPRTPGLPRSPGHGDERPAVLDEILAHRACPEDAHQEHPRRAVADGDLDVNLLAQQP